MSNNLSVRRVKVQTLNEKGEPIGEPTFGVMAADSYEQSYNDTYNTFQDLNDAIDKYGCILGIVQNFSDADREKIGTDNYYGGDCWKDD